MPLTDAKLFMALFGMTAAYFSGVMVGGQGWVCGMISFQYYNIGRPTSKITRCVLNLVLDSFDYRVVQVF